MTVETKQVQGRRELRFNSLDDILADAESITSQPVRALGNWTPGQILKHLAMTMDSAITGVDFKVSFPVRLVGKFIKKRFLTKPLPAGFRMPEKMKPHFMPPDEVTIEEGLAALRESLERFRNAPTLAPHAMFGNITREEHNMMHTRHAELHLSFLVPDESAAEA